MKTKFFMMSVIAMVSATSFAAASIQTAPNFKTIGRALKQINDPTHTLLVLDDDDTLTMMPCYDQKDPKTCQYIGGAAWWGWQDSLPHNSPYRVSRTNKGLSLDADAIMALSNMTYTDRRIPRVLSRFASRGGHVIIETARWPNMSNATEEQLSSLPVNINGHASNLSKFFNKYGLKSHQGIPSLASPYHPCHTNDNRVVRYEQGVYYVAGQNKGHLLGCLLRRTRSGFIRNIVFADDLNQNTVSVYRAFKNMPNIRAVSFHYTKLAKHKYDLTHGMYANRYQAQAKKTWVKIQGVVNRNFQNPAISK